MIEFFLKHTDTESNHKILEAISKKYYLFLVHIITKDKFINVDDPEKLLLTYIPIIA